MLSIMGRQPPEETQKSDLHLQGEKGAIHPESQHNFGISRGTM